MGWGGEIRENGKRTVQTFEQRTVQGTSDFFPYDTDTDTVLIIYVLLDLCSVWFVMCMQYAAKDRCDGSGRNLLRTTSNVTRPSRLRRSIGYCYCIDLIYQ